MVVTSATDGRFRAAFEARTPGGPPGQIEIRALRYPAGTGPLLLTIEDDTDEGHPVQYVIPYEGAMELAMAITGLIFTPPRRPGS